MNIQAMMKQAQSLQKEMMKVKEEIDSTEFMGESSLVKVKINGKKEILNIEIDKNEKIEMDDIEILEDMLVIAINNAMSQVDEMTEKKMGKFGNIPGLF